LKKYVNNLVKEFENDIPSVTDFTLNKNSSIYGDQGGSFDSYWNCTYCTFANPIEENECAMCFGERVF